MTEPYDDQAKPLAPLNLTTRSDQPNEDQYHNDQPKYVHSQSQTKLILCCGFIASLTMLIAVTFIVLSLTVFHLHNPNIIVDSISFMQQLDLVNSRFNTNQNVTVEISLRNPNHASLKVNDATVSFYLGELVVTGESIRSENIPVKVPARRTVKMNLTAEIDITKLLASIPSLMEDLNGKGVELKSSIVVIGEVKIMNFKKSVHLQNDCFMKMMMNSSLPIFHCSKTQELHKNMSKI